MMLLLLLLLARAPEPYEATVFPRLALPPVGAIVPNFHITIRITAPLTEANYCAGLEVTWPDGTRSSHVQDCPPYDEYLRQWAAYEACSDLVIVCPPSYTVCEYNCKEPFHLTREWTFDTLRMRQAYGPGRYEVKVRFLLPNDKSVVRFVGWEVAGE